MASVDRQAPKIDDRIFVQGFRGSIKYIGQVEGTSGIWYGVDWDDLSRGRHNGTKDGKRYFVTRFPGSGSFIRPSHSIIYGQSFIQALTAKYIEVAPASNQKEVVVLGSSRGVIEVEAVGLNRVRSKLAKLEYLSEVSLDTENVAYPDTPGEIRKTCPNIRSLDLSNSLLPSWEAVAIITNDLQNLRSLSLNHTRLALPSEAHILQHAFPKLEELRLDHTMIIWSEALRLLCLMPCLRYLELGYNKLKRLTSNNTVVPTALETINLDGNELNDWTDIMLSLRNFTSLKRVILTANHIRHIPLPALSQNEAATSVTHLGLHGNRLSKWNDVDALNTWLPNLQTLNITENPLVAGERDYRPILIARLPSLTCLNGTSISPRERTDSELYYLSQTAKSNFASDDELCNKKHPRWQELLHKHGTPDVVPEKIRNTLGHHLIGILVYRWEPKKLGDHGRKNSVVIPSSLPKTVLSQLPKITLRALPTMTLRAFRLKLLKELKRNGSEIHHTLHGNGSQLSVWLVMKDNKLSELDFTQQDNDLAWWGIQDGSQLIIFSQELVYCK